MATNNRGVDYADLWRIWKESPHYRPQIEHWMELKRTLPILPYKVQLEVLENCPMDIVKAHVHLLDKRARKALGLEEEKPASRGTKKKEWETWRAML